MVTRFFVASTVKGRKEIPVNWEHVLCLVPRQEPDGSWVTDIWIGDGVLKVADDVPALKARMNKAAGIDLFPVSDTTSAFLNVASQSAQKRLK